MGPHDSAARLGGDEFAVLHPLEGNARSEAGALTNRILEIVLKPYDIEGRKIIIGTSIGIARGARRRQRRRHLDAQC